MRHATLQFDAPSHGPRGQAFDQRAIASASWRTALLAGLLLAGTPAQEARSQDGEIPFDVASVFFELNDTDGDLGIHALIDGEPWKLLEIEGPNERVMLFVRGTGRLARQGLTELFFESEEPSFDELDPERFFRRFPEGRYRLVARTLDGGRLRGLVELTHVLPAPAGNVMISGLVPAEDCDAEDLPVVAGPVIVSWDPVTGSHPTIGRSDPAIEIVGYQFVVEREEPELRVFSVDLPPEVTAVEVPADFIALGDAFKFEIVAREASGNQTAVENCFEVGG